MVLNIICKFVRRKMGEAAIGFYGGAVNKICTKKQLKNILKHKAMGIIKEPKGVDFIIQSKPLTDKDRADISKFITDYKAKTKKSKK